MLCRVPHRVSASLRRAYEVRTGDEGLSALDRWLREHVSFLGPDFERDAAVTFADVCSAGEI